MELARIESLDVTREVAPDSIEATIGKLRSKWDISFPQGMMWGVLACASGFAITLVRERTHGTLTRLQVAPVTRAEILAGKALACFVAVLFVIGLMTVLGVQLGMRPESPVKLVVASLAIASCFVGVMMLMSVIGKSEESVSGAAWGVNVVMAMFGGGMIPLAFMPPFMKTLSHFSPVKWGVVALEGAIWRGFTFGELMVPWAILFTIGATCLAIGSLRVTRTV